MNEALRVALLAWAREQDDRCADAEHYPNIHIQMIDLLTRHDELAPTDSGWICSHCGRDIPRNIVHRCDMKATA